MTKHDMDPGVVRRGTRWGRVSGRDNGPQHRGRVQDILDIQDTHANPSRELGVVRGDVYPGKGTVSIERAAEREFRIKDVLDQAVEDGNRGVRGETGAPPCKRARRDQF